MTRAFVIPQSGKITAPMLAGRSDGKDLSTMTYPLGVTTKIDGVRCLKLDGRAVTRTFKPIPNTSIRQMIEQHLPDGMDMEITSGSNFQECMGNVMRESGEPDVIVWVIDYVPAALTMPYTERMTLAQNAVNLCKEKLYKEKLTGMTLRLLMPAIARSYDEVARLEAIALEAGHEGIMIRKLDAGYKCGRSTFNEGILVKVKRFADCEGVVTGVVEQEHNENAADKDAFGRTKRSTAQDGKVGAGVLGALTVVGQAGDYQGVTFNVGTGFTATQRSALWKIRTTLIGKIVTVKYFPTGTKDAPRFPTFKGFRDQRDVS